MADVQKLPQMRNFLSVACITTVQQRSYLLPVSYCNDQSVFQTSPLAAYINITSTIHSCSQIKRGILSKTNIYLRWETHMYVYFNKKDRRI